MKLTKSQIKQIIKEEIEELDEQASMLRKAFDGKGAGAFTSNLRGRVEAKNIQELNANIEALERRLTKVEDLLEQMSGKAVIPGRP
tara:strand:- start:851 stop:1108 length:258 start_codon:yes stop_codon:yes gene_type:complete